MHTAQILRRHLCLLILAAFVVTTMGCNKMLSNYDINQAQKRVDEAKKNEAEIHTPQELIQTQQALQTARGQFQSQQYQAARDEGKNALNQAKALLEKTKIARANTLKNESFRWLQIAENNNATAINKQAIDQVTVSDTQGKQQLEKKKYDRAIETFLKVITDVQYTLSNLEKQAKDGFNDTKTLRDQLVEEKAPEHAPEYVDQLNQQLLLIQTAIEKDVNYRLALRLRDQARQTQENGIRKTREVKSQKAIREIENLLDAATDLGSEVYAAQSFSVISKDFDNLLTQFYDKNYPTVLQRAPELKPRVEQLIVETKRMSALARIEAVQKAINNLSDRKVRTYLPGRIEELETTLAEAKTQFDLNTPEAYTESEKISLRGLELDQRVTADFDTLAQNEISSAQGEFTKAKSVFDTMAEIFEKPIPGDWTGDEQALEQSKQAMKSELGGSLNSAQVELGLAAIKREDKNFDIAIEMAKNIVQDAQNITQQTYRVVAHNAILEIANMVSIYERQGGRQYAADELDKTANLLEQTKQILKGGDYREAVRRAGDTKAQMEILRQELQRVAVKKIDDASQTLAQAKEHRADEYQDSALSQAMTALDRAKQSLQVKDLRESIESASQAETIASTASHKSLQQWADELIRQSDLLLAKAVESGVERYASEQLKQAVDYRNQLQSLYNQGAYLESIDIGQKTVNTANDALYAKVIEAEDKIATAQRFDGWKFETERLAQAIVSAKNARELLDKGNAAQSELFAQQAITTSENVVRDARIKSFQSRMASLEANLQEAEMKGAGYYQIKDLAKIMGEMNALRNEFDPMTSEDINQKVEKLDAQLNGLVEMTPDIIHELVLSLQDRLKKLEESGIRSQLPDKFETVENKIKYAQLDFKSEKYASSFANVKDANRTLNDIQAAVAERDFDRALHGQMVLFAEALEKFRPILNMGTTAAIQMVVSPYGKTQALSLMNAQSPSDLRSQINEIGARVRTLPAPPSRLHVRDSAVRMLLLASTAANNFEKLLIMDQYSMQDARDIVQNAFLQMLQAREQQQHLQRAIESPEIMTRPAGVERVMSYRGE